MILGQPFFVILHKNPPFSPNDMHKYRENPSTMAENLDFP